MSKEAIDLNEVSSSQTKDNALQNLQAMLQDEDDARAIPDQTEDQDSQVHRQLK
jgi:hypothetical protein